MILLQSLGYMALVILTLAFSWFMGYRILKHFGYKIVEEDKDDYTDTTGTINR